MKLLPMNPAPPVTSSFILAPRDLPDVLAGEVPREPTLVARRRLGREVQVGEIDDASRPLREVAHAVGDAGGDQEQARAAPARSWRRCRRRGASAPPRAPRRWRWRPRTSARGTRAWRRARIPSLHRARV